jgi:hypothetical protein
MNSTTTTIEYFSFEQDFVEENVRCIPMIVRFKLDACGIKLKLTEWAKMTVGERIALAESPCDTREEITLYKNYLQQLVLEHSGQEATELKIDESPLWAMLAEVPRLFLEKLKYYNVSVSVSQWQRLSTLQRFALLKLSSASHESKNFLKALRDFDLT